MKEMMRRTEPYGTPEMTGAESDVAPFTTLTAFG